MANGVISRNELMRSLFLSRTECLQLWVHWFILSNLYLSPCQASIYCLLQLQQRPQHNLSTGESLGNSLNGSRSGQPIRARVSPSRLDIILIACRKYTQRPFIRHCTVNSVPSTYLQTLQAFGLHSDGRFQPVLHFRFCVPLQFRFRHSGHTFQTPYVDRLRRV